MTNATTTAASMADWLTVLDRMQGAIERALTEVDSQERELESADADARSDLGTAEQQTLTNIDNRLAALQSRLNAAAETAAQIDAIVTHDESEVAAWRAASVVVRRNLTTLVGADVS